MRYGADAKDMDLQPMSALVRAAPLTPRPYEIVGMLGRGRTTELFLAIAPPESGLPRQVVVKALLPELLDDRDVCATFEHQARLAVKLRHPNVVTTFSDGHDGDRAFMVLELLEGQPLSRLRQRRDPVNAVPLAVHLQILADALGGLHCLHESSNDEAPHGVVHGDVCPENLFVTQGGATKVLHAGMDLADAETHLLKERLSYMSPEQARTDAVDRRSDVFSVGVLLWEAITGLRFWQDWHPMAILNRLCSDTLPLHPQWVPVGTSELFHIVERAVAPNPDDRYETAAEMRAAIEEVLARGHGSVSSTAVAAYMKSALVERPFWDQGDDPTLVREVPVPGARITLGETSDASPPSSKEPSTQGWTAPAGIVSVVPSARRRRPRALYAILGASTVTAGVVMLGVALFRLRDPRSPTPVVATPFAETAITSAAGAAAPVIAPCPAFPDPTNVVPAVAKPGETRNAGPWKAKRRNRIAEDPWGI